jgi:uncharacterized integral membrane protein
VRIPGTSVRGWRAIAVAAVALYILVFIVLNNRRLEINFVFFRIRSHELLAVIVIALLGFAAGFIFAGRRQRAQPAQSEPGILEAGTEASAPPQHEQGTPVAREDTR